MSIDQYYEEFCDILNYLDDKYESFTKESPRKSFLNVEMFWVYCDLRELCPDFIFESGVYKGRFSTFLAEATCRHSPGTKVFCADIGVDDGIDDAVLKDYNSIKVLKMPGQYAAKELCKYVPNHSSLIAIIDGPKFVKKRSSNLLIKRMYDRLFRRYECLALFQHDLDKEGARSKFVKYFDSLTISTGRNSYFIDFFSKKKMDKFLELDNDEHHAVEACMGKIRMRVQHENI